MKTILHFILRKSTIKLCLIVLFMFVFINESFSQPSSYDPDKEYSGSHTYTTHRVTVAVDEGEYYPSIVYAGEVKIDATYYGPYRPRVFAYLSVVNTSISELYISYRVIDRNVSITNTDITISYESDTSCPNYDMPCDITGHSSSIRYDWGDRARVTAMYKLNITVRLLHPPYATETIPGNDYRGFSISKDFYRGRQLN